MSEHDFRSDCCLYHYFASCDFWCYVRTRLGGRWKKKKILFCSYSGVRPATHARTGLAVLIRCGQCSAWPSGCKLVMPYSWRIGGTMTSFLRVIQHKCFWQSLATLELCCGVICLVRQAYPYKVPCNWTTCVDASDVFRGSCFPHHIAM